MVQKYFLKDLDNRKAPTLNCSVGLTSRICNFSEVPWRAVVIFKL